MNINEDRFILFLSFVLIPLGAWKLWAFLVLVVLIIIYVLTKNMNHVVVVGSIISGFALHDAVVHTAMSHQLFVFPLLGYWGYSVPYWILAYKIGIDS